MPFLVDVNLLLALVTDRHAHHQFAARRFEAIPDGEAVICRVCQLGLLRLLNNPAVMARDALDTGACWAIWDRLLQDARVAFTFNEPPGLDKILTELTAGRAYDARLWTDAYLAAYARAAGLTLLTFDRGFRKFADVNCEIIETTAPAQ